MLLLKNLLRKSTQHLLHFNFFWRITPALKYGDYPIDCYLLFQLPSPPPLVDIKSVHEVDIQNPEKKPIPRTFRLNESMDVDLNEKDISLDIPESEKPNEENNQ